MTANDKGGAMHPYLPHTPEDIRLMLERIGVSSVDDLYSDVPASLRMNGTYELPEGMSEQEVKAYFNKLRSESENDLVIFAGNGYYDHYAPAVIDSILSRSEFLTAYTPYQPEISQGTLQYIFEYQTIMSRLTGMDVCNASLYDGATATAEAMMMCVAAGRKRNRVLISETLLPAVADVCRTYARYHGIALDVVPERDGVTDREALRLALEADSTGIAGVIMQSPNRHGIIEDLEGVSDMVHNIKALLVLNTHATALSVLKTPAEWGVDVAVGEAQSLGMPLNYGGPGLGYMCTTNTLIRKMPGRIVGATVDKDGQRVFVLTLQAREQHIRRQKATSNICSNQGMMTLYVAMYTSLMGAEGLRRVNDLGCGAAHRLATGLEETGKMKRAYAEAPFLNEFEMVVEKPLTAQRVVEECLKYGILAGVALDEERLLVACTEMQSPEDINRYISIVQSL